MEFNDSVVRNYKFENLDKDAVGEEDTGPKYSTYGSHTYQVDNKTYGKSAYMLFYERRKKKDMRMVIQEGEVEKAKEAGIDVLYDEQKKEYSHFVKYQETTVDERPNNIYRKVFEDNKKFTFESDIYS